jgi:uncharacterized membrane protein
MTHRPQKSPARWHRLLTIGLLCAVSTLLLAGVAQACPNCKYAIADSSAGGTGSEVARGFYYSILFMMSMPFLLLGSFTSLMYVQVRRARRAAEHQDAARSKLVEQVREARGE